MSTKKRPIAQALLSREELAPFLPQHPIRPLRGLAYRVLEYVKGWTLTAPHKAILPFTIIEMALGISSDQLRSLRHNHSGLNRAISSLGLQEVGVTPGRMCGYQRLPAGLGKL